MNTPLVHCQIDCVSGTGADVIGECGTTLEGVHRLWRQVNYGVVDRSDWTWSVPFNAPRPAHSGQTSYSMPDEMFIANADCTQWMYFSRSMLDGDGQGMRQVYATNLNSSPHNVMIWDRAANGTAKEDPYIAN